MIGIPEQLKNPDFRFILLKEKGKTPLEQQWQSTNNYPYDDPILLEHISNGGNYGIVCGFGNLIIVDFDNKEVQEEVEQLLPKGFTVRASEFNHHYFITESIDGKIKPIKVNDKHNNTLADIQGDGKYIVAPNSVHPSGSVYTVTDDSPIPYIHYAELKACFKRYLGEDKQVVEQRKGGTMVQEIKSKISVPDMLRRYGITTDKNPTECPFHSSKGGRCFSFTDEVWHCFHCEKKGDVFTLYMEKQAVDFPTALTELATDLGVFPMAQPEKDAHPAYSEASLEDVKRAVMMQLITANRGEATELIVNYIMSRETIYSIMTINQSMEIWVYQDGIYTPFGRTVIDKYCGEILDKAYTPQLSNLITAKIQTKTYIHQSDFFNKEPPKLLCLNNGVFDIENKTLLPYSPEYFFFGKIPVDYNPTEDCPNVKAFFESVFIDPDEIMVMQELFGYILHKDPFLEKAIMLIGDGRNGKSKTMSLIKAFIGVDNCIELPLEQMEKDVFALAELHNKLVNLSGDISKTAIRNSANFKKTTGRDLISAARKFLTRLHFQNSAKMIFSCNELPPTADVSEAFFGRWLLLDYPYRFLSEQTIHQLFMSEVYLAGVEGRVEPTREEFVESQKIKLQDPDIIDKLTTPDELSGVLNWALEGLARIKLNKSFSKSPTMDAVKKQWLRKSNSANAFVMDCIRSNWGVYLTKLEMKKLYVDYCKVYGLKISTDYALKEALVNILGVTESRVMKDGERVYVWDGVSLRSEIEKKTVEKRSDSDSLFEE
jgi:P4 family phage/plasmid primase-like protien